MQKADSLNRKKSKRPYTSRSEDFKSEDQGEKESKRSSFNLNLLGYDLNDPKIKNTLGFILLSLIFVGIYISYKTVLSKGKDNSNLPKKSKKEKSKSK